MKNVLVMTGLTLGLISGSALGAGDPEAGKSKSGMCVACHGTDGNSLAPMYPNLAGQHAQYLETAIKAYRDGQRTGGTAPMMIPMAANLSDQDAADLAAYFSQQKLKQK
ncbi:c-type cytochrome [Bowmanella dokdonensis]|uniref:Cytochrome c n=1 Tax=Bowmanella dokdonensis TaxID=751969 RepID=A0A939DM64_9ALTE|nr:cytochrome c [Bowmanella dokdonensis]MBN7824336.1 cytochrome c [Bowmanella dokdonensis]